MSINLTAFFMAIYLFLSGLFYGDQPVKLDVRYCNLDDGVIVCERGEYAVAPDLNVPYIDGFNVKVVYQNVGRPYRGYEEADESPMVTIYQVVNGEQKTLRYDTMIDAVVATPKLIRHGDVRTISQAMTFDPSNTPAGTYSVNVEISDHNGNIAVSLTYPDILIIK